MHPADPVFWRTRRFDLDLSTPRVMGIVNVTPDSFFDGGAHDRADAAIAHAHQLVTEGADVLDIGGESTRPGAVPVSAQEEWQRIAPVVREALAWGVPVCVDTCKPEVMRRALDAGADAINDVDALQAEGALALVAAHPRVGVCLMHRRGTSATMQDHAQYEDVGAEVHRFLADRLKAALAAGLTPPQLVLDPGYGFAKTAAQNVALWRAQPGLLTLGQPLLVGWSRKSTLGVLTGRPVEDRLAASLAAALASVQLGARLVRVHDVAATRDALRIWDAALGG